MIRAKTSAPGQTERHGFRQRGRDESTRLRGGSVPRRRRGSPHRYWNGSLQRCTPGSGELSPPDSGARAEAIEVARLVFNQLDPAHDSRIPWAGPACPACGTELNVEIMRTSKGLKGCQRCPECDLALLIPDLFAM